MEKKKLESTLLLAMESRKYGDCLLTKMRKQLQLSKEEFADLIECPMTEEKLHEIYSKRELI